MMQTLDARVNWQFGWASSPNLQILIDEYPKEGKYLDYNGYYVSEANGIMSIHFCADQFVEIGDTGKTASGAPVSRGEGYGGRIFNIQHVDKGHLRLYGPWMSNSQDINKYVAFPFSCIEASIMDRSFCPLGWEQGFTFYSGFITLGLANKLIQQYLDPDIKIITEGDDYTPRIARIKPDGTEWSKFDWFKTRSTMMYIGDKYADITDETWTYVRRNSELFALAGHGGIAREFPNTSRIRG